MKEYDFQKLLGKFFKYKWWIAVASLLGMATALVLATFFVIPQYQMTSQILVIPNTPEQNTALQNTEIQANLQLIDTYKALIGSPRILNEVNKDLSNKYSTGELRKNIEAATEENSQIINITVTTDNPNEAAAISNSTAKIFIKTAAEIMASSHLEILDEAVVTPRTKPFFPSKRNFALLGMTAGFLLSSGIVSLLFLFSNKLKSENELSELTVPILGIVGAINDHYPNQKEGSAK